MDSRNERGLFFLGEYMSVFSPDDDEFSYSTMFVDCTEYSPEFAEYVLLELMKDRTPKGGDTPKIRATMHPDGVYLRGGCIPLSSTGVGTIIRDPKALREMARLSIADTEHLIREHFTGHRKWTAPEEPASLSSQRNMSEHLAYFRAVIADS